MENEDYIINLADFYGHHIGNGVTEFRNSKPDPDFNGDPYTKPIVIPQIFKEVVLKMCPDIKDIVSVGYRDIKVYNPETFDPVFRYLVGVDLYFDEKSCMGKPKKEYNDELNDFFKMTYDGMSFVSFHVRSYIFPPEKTNEDKFFEVFGVTEK